MISPIIYIFLLIIMFIILGMNLYNISNVSLSFIDSQLWLFYNRKSMDGMMSGFYRDQKFAKMLIDFNKPRRDPY